MRKILFLSLFLFSFVLRSGFDTSDRIIIKSGKVVGGIAGASTGAAAGVGVGIASGQVAKKVTEAEIRKHRKKFVEKHYSKSTAEEKRDEVERYMRDNPRRFLGIEDGREYYQDPKAAELNIGIGVGTAATATGATAGGVLGSKLGDKAAYWAVARKHKVSKNIVKVAYANDVSLSFYRAVLIAAEKGQREIVKKMLSTIYKNLFVFHKLIPGADGISKFKTLLNQYDSFGRYQNRDAAFKSNVGETIFQKFQEAVSITSAVESLLAHKIPDTFPTLSEKVRSCEKLMRSLF